MSSQQDVRLVAGGRHDRRCRPRRRAAHRRACRSRRHRSSRSRRDGGDQPGRGGALHHRVVDRDLGQRRPDLAEHLVLRRACPRRRRSGPARRAAPAAGGPARRGTRRPARRTCRRSTSTRPDATYAVGDVARRLLLELLDPADRTAVRPSAAALQVAVPGLRVRRRDPDRSSAGPARRRRSRPGRSRRTRSASRIEWSAANAPMIASGSRRGDDRGGQPDRGARVPWRRLDQDVLRRQRPLAWRATPAACATPVTT